MPWIVAAAAVVGAAAAVKGGIDARKAAGQQQEYNAEVERLQEQYSRDVMNFQNGQYAEDVDFFNRQIAWQEKEHSKNMARAKDAVAITNEDFFGKLSTAFTRVVEQDIAESLSVMDISRQVRTETGAQEARIADSGVSGNTVDILRGDIQRQGGEAKNITGMNAQAARNQLGLEIRGVKTQRDAQLSSITIPTFQPLQAPGAPAPVSPVNPAAPVSRPSIATIAMNGVSSGINLGVNVNNFGQGLKLW